MIALLFLLAQESRVVHDPSSGARFTIPANWTLRSGDFKFDWADTRTEFASPDGSIGGLLYATRMGWAVAPLAAWREKSLREATGTDSLSVTKESAPARARALWIEREYRLVFRGSAFRYVDVYYAKGRHNVELVLWCPESGWKERQGAMRGVAASMEFAGTWTCPRCGREGLSDPNSCARCGKVAGTTHEGLRKIAAAHAIQIVLDPKGVYPNRCASGSVIAAERASARLLSDYSEKLARELAKYPEAALRKLGIERILLVQDVRLNGNKVGAVTDHERDSMHLEVREGRDIPLFFEETVHHELFHLLDQRDDGSSTADPAWEKLNPAGFRYDPSTRASGRFEDDLEGFLNTYSMTAVGEDKAEIFGQSMTRGRALSARAAKDRIIKNKIARIKELARSFEPGMDEAFWKRVEQ